MKSAWICNMKSAMEMLEGGTLKQRIRYNGIKNRRKRRITVVLRKPQRSIRE